MISHRVITENGYSKITLTNGDMVNEHLEAVYAPNYRSGLRTAHGRRRLQRFIDRLQKTLNESEVMYGKD